MRASGGVWTVPGTDAANETETQMFAGMTAPLWKAGFRNMLVCSVGILAFMGALTLTILVVNPEHFWVSYFLGYGVFMLLAFAFFFVDWWRGRRSAGAILLDCGPFPNRIPVSMAVALSLAFSAVCVYELASLNLYKLAIVAAVFGLFTTGYFLIIAFGRLQIRGNGIWQYVGLLRWDRILDFRWEGDTNPTLVLHARSRVPFWGRGALPVPNEHRNAIDELIRKHTTAEAIPHRSSFPETGSR